MGNVFETQKTVPATIATSIATNATGQNPSRGIFIGVAGDYDFYVNGSWVAFTGCVAGSVLPIVATGARDNGDQSSPAAGEIVFLR